MYEVRIYRLLKVFLNYLLERKNRAKRIILIGIP